MKKIFLTGFLSILFVGISFAQAPKIGVTAGLNVSNLTGSGTSGSYKAGFQAGVVADFGITEKFSIMPELLFAQRGAKDSEEGVDVTMTLNYLQLPINAAYKFDVGNGSKVFVFAGPYFGYGLSGKATAKNGANGINVSASQDIKFGSSDDKLKAFDIGLNVGVGYLYEKIFFKLQFNPGFANLLNNSGSDSMRNTNFAVTVGYFFN